LGTFVVTYVWQKRIYSAVVNCQQQIFFISSVLSTRLYETRLAHPMEKQKNMLPRHNSMDSSTNLAENVITTGACWACMEQAVEWWLYSISLFSSSRNLAAQPIFKGPGFVPDLERMEGKGG
jgi:hypothetical protein